MRRRLEGEPDRHAHTRRRPLEAEAERCSFTAPAGSPAPTPAAGSLPTRRPANHPPPATSPEAWQPTTAAARRRRGRRGR
eukprot:CAMPEP_0170440648 /NCGR_PEP_ID=MMETSP0117_2-20130122/46448_1 /TAXON_ID=400756 /ORGANISM="Durinskia baltica, Strain CSIRO CS-38" /LENGTH=79 /DNA_ID=CAMNT_0010701087 /DNA_START=97 /DNA_END=332 /DNA_ORIENTATION=-